MSFSSGTYTLPQAAFVFDTVISETAVNSNFSDIATALSTCVLKDGTQTVTANLPMNSRKHTGVLAGTLLTDYGDVRSVQNGTYLFAGTAGGSANALTLTLAPATAALVAGQEFRWKASSSANTGAATVAVSGLGTVALQINGAALAAGQHAANKYYRGLYDGTAMQIEQISGQMLDPMTTRGDIIIRNSSNATARLAVGDAGQALTSDGTAASWTTLAGGGPSKGTAPSTFYRTNGRVQTESLEISNNNLTFTSVHAAETLSRGTNDGYATDMLVRLSGSDLPNGFLEDTDYYCRDVGASTMKLALTIGGSAVTISDDGSGTNKVYEVISASCTGPISIKAGVSLTVPSGSRVVIQ